MKTVRLSAPAKTNIYLKTVKKRSDGFNELDTVFARLSIGDELSLTKRRDGRIRLKCSVKSLPTGPKNLVYQTADLMRRIYGISTGVDIVLKKNMPIASGIGAGSSDAASTILGMNRLFNLKLSQHAMLDIAALIGSDVPFFITGCRFAHGKGRGELLTPISSKLTLHLVLMTPKLKIMAKDAYQALTPGIRKLGNNSIKVRRALKQSDRSTAVSAAFNTLEVCLESRYPSIVKMRQQLTEAGADRAMLSGSGPTVVGFFSSRKKAESATRKLQRKFPSRFIRYCTTQ